MKAAIFGTLLALAPLSVFACEYDDGTKYDGLQCTYHCTPSSATKKTTIVCGSFDPLYQEIQTACGGDPEDSDCETLGYKGNVR